MFYFITTIRHPSNAKNYDTIIKLLQLTIESVCSQKTNSPYKFLIVCNEKPNIDVDSTKVEFLDVDFPSPGAGKGTTLAFENVLIDKGSKLAAGLAYIEQYSPSKVFIIDADDWVNSDIVEFISTHADVPFWHVDRGQLINFNSRTSTRKHGLCRYCGSTFIYDYKKLLGIIQYKGAFNKALSQEEIIRNIDDFGMRYLLGDHRRQLGYFHKQGLTITPLPLQAICWILDTGENHSGKTGGEQGVPLTTKVLSEFGIKSVSSSIKKTTSVARIREMIAKITSYIGWLKTDKTADKV